MSGMNTPTPRFPQQSETGHDLVADDDLTIGPLDVRRAVAVIIAAHSTDDNEWSAAVEWTDGDGTVFRTQSASDVDLSSVVDDSSRLFRKGEAVVVTFTDESGGDSNEINAFVDTHA